MDVNINITAIKIEFLLRDGSTLITFEVNYNPITTSFDVMSPETNVIVATGTDPQKAFDNFNKYYQDDNL